MIMRMLSSMIPILKDELIVHIDVMEYFATLSYSNLMHGIHPFMIENSDGVCNQMLIHMIDFASFLFWIGLKTLFSFLILCCVCLLVIMCLLFFFSQSTAGFVNLENHRNERNPRRLFMI